VEKKKNYRTRYHRAREPKTVYALSAAPRTATGATTRQLRHRGAARPRCGHGRNQKRSGKRLPPPP